MSTLIDTELPSLSISSMMASQHSLECFVRFLLSFFRSQALFVSSRFLLLQSLLSEGDLTSYFQDRLNFLTDSFFLLLSSSDDEELEELEESEEFPAMI